MCDCTFSIDREREREREFKRPEIIDDLCTYAAHPLKHRRFGCRWRTPSSTSSSWIGSNCTHVYFHPPFWSIVFGHFPRFVQFLIGHWMLVLFHSLLVFETCFFFINWNNFTFLFRTCPRRCVYSERPAFAFEYFIFIRYIRIALDNNICWN